MTNTKEKHSKATTLIADNVDILGNIAFSGDLRVEGNVEGNIGSKPNANKATLTVSDQGNVLGEIRAPRVIINGIVHGDVYATEHLELAKKAKVTGNVYYAKMEMVMGATVNGKLVHTSEFTPPTPQATSTGKKGIQAQASSKNDEKNVAELPV